MSELSSDGIMGLAYPNSTFDNDESLFFNLWNRSLISKPAFSFYINPYVKTKNIELFDFICFLFFVQ